MKILVLRSIAVIAIGASMPAHAADMAVKAPPYYNVVRPTNAPDWQLRAEFSLLFPER